MHFSHIVCLDDLTRGDTWPTSELVFDLVRLPIYHASGLNIGRGAHRPQQSNLSEGFSLNRFRHLCEVDGRQPAWHELHHAVPPAAAEHLLAHLPTNVLVLGHAMPPWLLGLLHAHDIAYVDLRTSPLRFASDLVVGLGTNRRLLHEQAHTLALGSAQLLSEANLMAARLRLARRSEGRLRLAANPCVYVGQTGDDPALLGADGRFARVQDHAEVLNRLAATGPVLYLPHPEAGEFARQERAAIEAAIGRQVPLCDLDCYDLLACDDDLMLIGLNADALQEASWFGRPAYALCPLPGVPSFDADAAGRGSLQIAPQVLMGEALWARLLGCEPRPGALNPPAVPHQLRGLMNDWRGWASATLRGHGALREAFALAGGQQQADALRRCEDELADTRRALAELGAELGRLNALVERQSRLGNSQVA